MKAPVSDERRRDRKLPMATMALLLALVTAWAWWAALSPAPAAARTGAQPQVWRTRVAGTVDAPLAGYLARTIDRAAMAGAAALIIELDTPGGLDSAMRQIIQAETEAPLPVVVFVSPTGARSASAGVYIMMGADVSAMAPQTNLGAAQPVSLTGDMDEAMRTKVINDAAAYMRGLAEAGGRNAVWAEQAVRESVSLTATEALEQNVIDLMAEDFDDLLVQMDGFTTVAKGLVVKTADARVVEVEMPWWERLLRVIANPEIAFILLLVGVYGIVFEFSAPGLGVSGVLGFVCILVALYGLQLLPVNWFGFALVLLALALYVAEVFVTSFGLLTLAGTVCLLLGGLLLFDLPQFFRLSWWVLAPAAAVSIGFFGFVVRAALRDRRKPPVGGPQDMVGAAAVVLTPLQPEGQVRVRGQIWKASVVEPTDALPVEPEEVVEVVSLEGLRLGVRRMQSGSLPEKGTEKA